MQDAIFKSYACTNSHSKRSFVVCNGSRAESRRFQQGKLAIEGEEVSSSHQKVLKVASEIPPAPSLERQQIMMDLRADEAAAKTLEQFERRFLDPFREETSLANPGSPHAQFHKRSIGIDVS